MSDVKQEDFELVTDALTDFFNHATQSKNFNLSELTDFMEKIFKQTGYRELSENLQNNILIMHDYAVGDFILITGVIREIRRLYPYAHITLMVHPCALSMAECCPYVDEVILYDADYKNRNDIAQFYQPALKSARELLKRRIDVCFAFTNYADSAFLMYISGAKTRIVRQFPKSSDVYESYAHFSNIVIPLSFVHNADCFMFFVECILHARVFNRELEAWFTPYDVNVAKKFLAENTLPTYALCMGSTSLRRHYPPEKYAALVEMILSDENATFVILGGGHEDLKSAKIFKKALTKNYLDNIIDLTNKLTYRQSAALLSLCDMYIGNDTGVMHAAAAVKCPVLTPNCCGADLPHQELRIVQCCSPYRVPSVVVQPAHALPECDANKPYDTFGCREKIPHCITQIEPQTLFKGFKILQERISQNLFEPIYIS